MNWLSVMQGVVTAVALAIIFGIAKLFQRLNTLETRTEPLIEWWKKTSMDALKIATNPTSDRLTELGEMYSKHVTEGKPMTPQDKQELINGLREIMNDPGQYADKRQSASLSLRFIESQEGLSNKHH